MLDGQMFKMFAAAIGMTPADMQQAVRNVVEFVGTSEARLTAIEKQVAEIHAAVVPPDASQMVIDGHAKEIGHEPHHVS